MPHRGKEHGVGVGCVREKDNDVRAFVWNRRGVVGSLERGSSEVFYWEFVCFSRRPFIYSHRRF